MRKLYVVCIILSLTCLVATANKGEPAILFEIDGSATFQQVADTLPAGST